MQERLVASVTHNPRSQCIDVTAFSFLSSLTHIQAKIGHLDKRGSTSCFIHWGGTMKVKSVLQDVYEGARKLDSLLKAVVHHCSP